MRGRAYDIHVHTAYSCTKLHVRTCVDAEKEGALRSSCRAAKHNDKPRKYSCSVYRYLVPGNFDKSLWEQDFTPGTTECERHLEYYPFRIATTILGTNHEYLEVFGLATWCWCSKQLPVSTRYIDSQLLFDPQIL